MMAVYSSNKWIAQATLLLVVDSTQFGVDAAPQENMLGVGQELFRLRSDIC